MVIRDLSQVECLVLEGGGIKVLSFLGTFLNLEASNLFHLQQIKKIAGSSAGAFIGFFIVCGLSITAIINECLALDFSKITTTSNYLFDSINIIETYGFDRGVLLLKTLEHFVQKYASDGKSVTASTTFEELFAKFPIEYVVTATNISKNRTDYFSRKTTPTMKITDALRISMSYPIAFSPVVLNGDYLVDGSFLNPYPIWYFDTDYPTDVVDSKILGLKVLSEGETSTNSIMDTNIKISNVKDFLTAMANTAEVQVERGYIKPGYWARTIPVQCNGFLTLDFSLTVPQKQQLIDLGKQAFNKYFAVN